MNKAELIEIQVKKTGMNRKTATEALENFIDTVVRAVNKGDSVTITGFGVFEKRRRAARVARNPRTGETVKVKPTSVPVFRPGAQFKAIVAGKQKITASAPAVKRGSAAAVVSKKTSATKKPVRKTTAKSVATRVGSRTAAATKSVAKKTNKSATTGRAKTTKRTTTKTRGKK